MTTLGHRILLQVQGFWKRKLRYLGTEITDTINLDNKERVGDCTAVEKAVAPHSSTLAWKIHGRRSLGTATALRARNLLRQGNAALCI